MSDRNKVRLAHELLDEVNAREDLTPRQVGVLRSFLPERPERKTLEDVYREVCNAWYRTDGDVWKADAFGELEDWLRELHEQLKGLIDSKPASPALPAGMRLADHEEYGRVVASPGADEDLDYKIFFTENYGEYGADYSYASTDKLTFIDAEPTEPAHPEFLETEADYTNAPVGTVVARDNGLPWVKEKSNYWTRPDAAKSDYGMSLGSRRVLRWGWGE